MTERDKLPAVESSDKSNADIEELELKISQLADDNEHYQDILEEFKSERQAVEAELREKIQSLETQLADKCQALDLISQTVDNKDKLLSEAYDSVNELKMQLSQAKLELQSNQGIGESLANELKKENENLIDIIRQLSTTGALDAPTIQRLRDEISQAQQQSYRSADMETSDDLIDWHAAFNDLQIEVEYLRSQNALFLSKMQEAGLALDSMEMADIESQREEVREDVRFEFDTAVRSLHERDMRCQELTWEITKVYFFLSNKQLSGVFDCIVFYFFIFFFLVVGRAGHAPIAVIQCSQTEP